ncbi:MAG: restriction endonuclease subunit S [Pseudomonadota bacterium]|nr:restriction endonuclease subunit S [Pseudomonadota bacterium]
MSFPRYPEYKDRGVEWLGEVRANWRTKRLSYLFRQISSGTTPQSEYDENYGGDISWVTTGELREEFIDSTEKSVTEAALKKYSALKIYPAGTLLMAMYGATIGRLGILRVAACTNQACCAFSEPIDASVRFVFYCLLAARDHLILIASGGGQPNINQDKIRSLRLATPPIAEQTAITAFLDRETAKIDALVAEQEKLIALLKEKRQAVISHAVTKGLNPDAPMKLSGIEWLGDVPAHWEVKRLSHLFKVISSGTTPSSDDADSYDGDIFWVTTGELREDLITATEKTVTASALSKYSALKIYPPGTLLMAMYGATIGRLGTLLVPATTNQACCALAEPENTSVSFIFYALLSARDHLLLIASGGGQPNINQDKIRSLRLPVPVLAEQTNIAAFLDRETGKIDEMVAQADCAITLLKERRSALISAAVTGQIDVRSLVPVKAA